MDDKSETKKNIVASKFEKVVPVSKSETILNEYYSIIEKLKGLCLIEYRPYYITDKIFINMIFDIKDVNTNYLKVINYKGHFEIILNFESEETTRVKSIKLTKMRYKFNYQNNQYYCFEIDYLSNYLEGLKKKHEYFIEITSEPYKNKQVKEIEQFMMLDSFEFNILISYQYKDIDYNSLNYDSIYINNRIFCSMKSIE